MTEQIPEADISVYQFKVTLRGIHPPIWRRFQVKSNITLYDLHLVLQAVMGWENDHLYEFDIDGVSFSDPDPDFGGIAEEAGEAILQQVLTRPKMRFLYTYDFGDSWEHEIVLEKILSPAEGVRYPICIAGARACPPEDCGGVWGYERLLRILRDPQHKEYQEVVEWLGEGFDPEFFDLDEINEDLKCLRLS